jgi:hypothetical protein
MQKEAIFDKNNFKTTYFETLRTIFHKQPNFNKVFTSSNAKSNLISSLPMVGGRCGNII